MSERKRRSKLELRFEDILLEAKAEYEYEVTVIPYIVPESSHKYTVDWTLLNGLLIETKGYLSDHQERNKYVLLKQQYPELDLRFVFDNPNKLCGGTKYSHAKWADKYGFQWCGIKDVETIQSWISNTH
jgi:Phage endonuclease I